MSETQSLNSGDQVPHIEITDLSGSIFRYSSIWQHSNLLLITVPQTDGHANYVADLSRRDSDFRDRHAVCVVTRNAVLGMPTPGVLVADRWGEIIHIAAAGRVDDLPPPLELLKWLDYIEQRCPECEGEAR